MRLLIALLLMLGVGFVAAGQEARHFDPKISYSVFAEYSNDSSRMIIGASQNRRLFAAGADYSRRLVRRSNYAWRYEIEVIPLELLQNPKLTTTVTSTAIGYPTSITFPVGTYQYSGWEQKQCVSSAGSGTYYEPGATGQPIAVGTYTYTGVCSNPWTYGGGVSPLGQKVNFLPRSRLQPYVTANAGFVVFSRIVPSDGATMFNFSFEFGGGLEWDMKPNRAWSLDYRYHHISNAGRGVTNPGVDNGTFRVSYSLGH